MNGRERVLKFLDGKAAHIQLELTDTAGTVVTAEGDLVIAAT